MTKGFKACVKVTINSSVIYAFFLDIDLSHLKLLSDRGVIHIARHCDNLKSLIIEKCDQITDQAIN